MLILLLVILLVIFCFSLYKNSREDSTVYVFVQSFLGIILLSILAFLLSSICALVDSMYIDDKISVYQEENTNIENSLDVIVEQYYDNTKEIYSIMKNDNAISNVIALYPELNNNEVVVKQMDMYVNNNKQIKKLKLQKIDTKVYKWLLYFGG